jgi:hypothetical protein
VKSLILTGSSIIVLALTGPCLAEGCYLATCPNLVAAAHTFCGPNLTGTAIDTSGRIVCPDGSVHYANGGSSQLTAWDRVCRNVAVVDNHLPESLWQHCFKQGRLGQTGQGDECDQVAGACKGIPEYGGIDGSINPKGWESACEAAGGVCGNQ